MERVVKGKVIDIFYLLFISEDEEDDEEREAFEFDVDEQRPVFQPAVDHLKREFESLKINRVSPST